MATEITVPRLGWSMDEGTFVEWLKQDGQPVRPGEPLFVLEGDKAAQEVECFDDGVLRIRPDGPAPGDVVAVGQVLGYLVPVNEAAGWEMPARTAVVEAQVAAVESRLESPSGQPALPAENTSARHVRGRIAITPRARRAARQLGVEAAAVRGSGRHGRIRERDILTAAGHRGAGERAAESELLVGLASGRFVPASPHRRTIARRMQAAVQQAAPVTLTARADADRLVAVREAFKRQREPADVPSYEHLLIRLVAKALSDQPQLNACWRDDGVWQFDDVNIAFAVDTPAGLLAPVLRGVPALSLDEIAARSRALVELARGGRLTAEQQQGGTFTLTNLGLYGIDFFTPLLNLPQAAILGVGQIGREPVVRGEAIVPAWRLGLSLTFDHRVLDGAPAARWLQHLCHLIAHVDAAA